MVHQKQEKFAAKYARRVRCTMSHGVIYSTWRIEIQERDVTSNMIHNFNMNILKPLLYIVWQLEERKFICAIQLIVRCEPINASENSGSSFTLYFFLKTLQIYVSRSAKIFVATTQPHLTNFAVVL